MKKILALILTFAILFSGCAAPSAKTELIVFAAASMTESLQEIAKQYESIAPDVELVFNFDSSGTLRSQIIEGAPCDIFLSAAQKQMDELDEAKLLLADTRIDLLENQMVLAVPKGNRANIHAFEDVLNAYSIAIGNPDVPVGQYSEQYFRDLGLWDAIQDRLTYGSNAKEVTAWVSEGAVDCGVVYHTDAAAADLEVVASAALQTPITYPVAVLGATANEAAAKAFLAYLQSDACRAVFESCGFSVMH